MTAAAEHPPRALGDDHGPATKGPSARGRTRWLRRGLVAAGAIAVVVALAYGFAPRPVAVDLAVASLGPLRVTVDEDGKTRLKDRYLVSAPLAGNLRRIELRPGDVVEKGMVLAQVLPLDAPLLDARTRAGAESRLAAAVAANRQADAAVVRANAAFELAMREAERTRALSKSGSIADVELDRAETELRARREDVASAEFGAKVAKHEAEIAESALQRVRGGRAPAGEQLDVPAPVDGVVLRVLQESEGAVSPGAPLLEIGDPSRLELVIDVLTTDAVAVPPGAAATIERWGEREPLAAHVRVVEPAAFTKLSALGVEEQRVNVILDLDAPRARWTRLGDGYRVEARILVWSHPSVLRVSEGALFRRGGGWAVYRVARGRARETAVELGHRNGREAEVLAGLEAGDEVVDHPSDRITSGTRVRRRSASERPR